METVLVGNVVSARACKIRDINNEESMESQRARGIR